MKPLDSFFFETVKPFQCQYKNRINKNTFFTAICTNITYIDDPVEKGVPQNDDPVVFDLPLDNNSSISKKYGDIEMEQLQMQTNHETSSSLTKQSLKNSFSDPSYTTKNTELCFFETPSVGETKLKYRKTVPVMKIVFKWFSESSRTVVGTPIITAKPFLLEFGPINPNP